MIPSTVSTAEAVDTSPDFSVLQAVAQGVLVFGDCGTATPPVFVNDAMTALAGRDRMALCAEWPRPFLGDAEAARLRGAVARALADGEAECRDLLGHGAGARRLVLHVRLRRLPASGHVLATFEDVTRLVDAVERLVVNESRYRALTESTNDVFVVLNHDCTIRSGSPAVMPLLGCEPGQVHGTPVFDFVHAEDQPAVHDMIDRITAGTAPGSIEARIRHQRGHYLWMEVEARDLRHDPAVDGMVCHLHDITERRRAQDSIVAREALLRSLFDYSYNLTVVTDVSGAIRFISGNAEREIGCPAEELLGCNAFEYIHPDDRALVADRLRDHIDNLPTVRGRATELRVRHQDGRWPWFEARSVNCIGVPGVDGIMTQMHSIDARKAAETELSRMRALVASAVGVARVGAWEYDVDGDHVEWLNDEYFRIVGEDPVAGRIAHRQCRSGILDEDWPAMEAALKGCLMGPTELFECEYRVRTATGEPRWLLDRGRVIARAATGRATRMGGVTLDIDERKRAEVALRESERRFETVLWGSGIAFWVTDADTNILEVSAQFATVTGSTLGTPGRRSAGQLLDHIHPDDREAFARQVTAHLRGEAPAIDLELRFSTDGGGWVWLHNRGRAIEFDETGRPTRLAGTIIDVTARREVEEHHRMQASMLQALSEGVLVCDGAGRVTYGNAAATMMLGLDPVRLIGQRIDVLLPSSHGDWRWSEPFNGGVMSADGHPHRLETALLRPDGSTILVSATVALSQFLGAPRWVVVLQNVTTQRRLEREIIEIANREQERIGRDLHDGLGQDLTGIALMLGGLASRMQRELPAVRPDVDEIMDLVAQAVQSTRTLARGLSPVAIERAGLVSALRDLAGRSREIMGLDVRVRSVVRPGADLDAVMATQLYRVAQEALTNVVRHAGATRATLSCRLTDHMIVLSVSDDGVGISPGALTGPGLGLKIIAYRARMIGGMATCERRPRGGTRVVVRVRRGAVGGHSRVKA